MKIIKPSPLRLAGVSAMVAGVCFVIVGLFHPPNAAAEVANATWIKVHLVAILMCFFGLFGIIGLYAKQAEKAGWLGLIGTFLLSGWFVIVTGFSFIEAFILPHLKTGWLAFVESFLGMFTGKAGTIDMGLLPLLWNVSGPMLILGLLLFGIATFLAGVLPRYAGGLLGASAVLIPLGALLPPDYESLILLPIGAAFAWLGFALFRNKEPQKIQTVNPKANPKKDKLQKEKLPKEKTPAK